MLTKRAFLLETADGAVVVDGAGMVVGCTAVDIEIADCGIIGVTALKSAKRRSRSATAFAGLEAVAVVDVVEVDDVASDFGFDIIMVNSKSFKKFRFDQILFCSIQNCYYSRVEVRKKYEHYSIRQQSYIDMKFLIVNTLLTSKRSQFAIIKTYPWAITYNITKALFAVH
jgi:hypothetical protein